MLQDDSGCIEGESVSPSSVRKRKRRVSLIWERREGGRLPHPGPGRFGRTLIPHCFGKKGASVLGGTLWEGTGRAGGR